MELQQYFSENFRVISFELINDSLQEFWVTQIDVLEQEGLDGRLGEILIYLGGTFRCSEDT